MTQKIQVSKAGYSALTETDPNNLIFSSDYNTLKYHSSGEKIVTVDYSNFVRSYKWDPPIAATWYVHSVVDSVTHGLGYVPYFIVYVISYDSNYSMAPFLFADSGYSTFVQAYADNDKIYFKADIINQTNSGTINRNFYYKIFKNKLNL